MCIRDRFISPWKRAWLFNLINLNPFTEIRLLYTRFIWNWPIGSGESFFLKIINIFSLRFFFQLSPLEKGMDLYLWKSEFSLLKDALRKFGWIWFDGSRKEDENVKLITDRQMDCRQTKGGQESLFSSGKLNMFSLKFLYWTIWLFVIVIQIGQEY